MHNIGRNGLTSTLLQIELVLDRPVVVLVTPDEIRGLEVAECVVSEKFDHVWLAHALELPFVVLAELAVLNLAQERGIQPLDCCV